MTPYYPARDGYPSMFEAEGNAGAAVGGKPLHRSFVDRLLANQFPVPRRSARPRRRSTVRDTFPTFRSSRKARAWTHESGTATVPETSDASRSSEPGKLPVSPLFSVGR